tara:strand:+ start:167 stop:340 length:174 start_codon:yes stop_codon:yes gene_type:complete
MDFGIVVRNREEAAWLRRERAAFALGDMALKELITIIEQQEAEIAEQKAEIAELKMR